MEPSYKFPDDDYALAVLTQAAMQNHDLDASSNSNNQGSQSHNNSLQHSRFNQRPAATSGGASTSGLTRAEVRITDPLSENDFSTFRNDINHDAPNRSFSQSHISELLDDSGYSNNHNPKVLSSTHNMASMATLAYAAPHQRAHTSSYMNPSYQGIGAQISANFANSHSTLGILSAESYDDGRLAMSTRGASGASGARKGHVMESVNVMPFGVQDAEARTDSDEFEKGAAKGTRRRKRGVEKTVDVDEDEEARKKARGRPRVDTKDETAADRRRTQIRMAQRAYRHRKETTITSLEQQVQELRGTNEEMSNIFISLYDFAVGKGLLQREPEFGQQLQSTTERFLALAKATAHEDGHEETLAEDAEKPDEPTRRTKGPKASPKKRHEDVPHIAEPANPWGGYTMSKDDTPEDDLSIDFPQQSYENRGRQSDLQIITRPSEDNASFPFDLMDLQQYRVELPSLEDYSQNFFPESQLPLPKSHNYNELSFARRIHRGAIERAFRLFNSTDTTTSDLFDRVFGLTLMYNSRETIEEGLRRAVKKNTNEPLAQWRNPFVHIGGSGTFYPDTDPSNDLVRPKFRTGYSMGPFTPSAMEADEFMQEDMRCTLPGYEGEFFDSNDVEGYLRGRGLDIPPATDFITAEIDVSILTEASSPRSTSSVDPLSPKTPESPIDKMTPSINAGYAFDYNHAEPKAFPFPPIKYNNSWETQKMTLDSNIDPIFTTLSNPVFGQHTPESAGSDVPFSEKRLVTINVNTLLDKILSKGVCLGRAPGFRPSDVNAAIVAAVRAGF